MNSKINFNKNFYNVFNSIKYYNELVFILDS